MTVHQLIRALRAFEPGQQVVVECEHDAYSFHRLSDGRGPDPDLDERGKPILILRSTLGEAETIQLDWE